LACGCGQENRLTFPKIIAEKLSLAVTENMTMFENYARFNIFVIGRLRCYKSLQ